ncbi:P-loop containing nucleoside triphosphate hydrolase protein, partial [Xylariaceae sp. FL0662B]
MSKHRLEDAEEVEAVVPRKKSKKDRKDKKERKDKPCNANSDAVMLGEVEEAPVEPEANSDTDAEMKMKKEKKDKDKKKKKDKKEKKDKKKRNAEAEISDAVNRDGNGQALGTVNNAAKSFSASSTPGVYEQTASLTAVPESEVTTFLSTHQITIDDPRSTNPLRPIMQFTHLPSSALILKTPFASFKAPTPVQAASWPFGLSGRDIVGVAETGSGKTIAFGLPLVTAVLDVPKSKGSSKIRAVVVSPTRELAMQTNEQLS